MTRSEIDFAAIEQYQKIFGKEKICSLWDEFKNDTMKDLEEIENKEREDIRLKFHSWRSSSLVFGLTGFSAECEKAEKMVLEGQNSENIKKAIDNCKKIFHNIQKEVERFLKGDSYGKDCNRK